MSGTGYCLSSFFSILPNIFFFLLLQKPNSFDSLSPALLPIAVNDPPPCQSCAFTDDLVHALLFFSISVPVTILSDFKFRLDGPFNTSPHCSLKEAPETFPGSHLSETPTCALILLALSTPITGPVPPFLYHSLPIKPTCLYTSILFPLGSLRSSVHFILLFSYFLPYPA